MVTFSARLLVRQSVQLRMDEITGEIGLSRENMFTSTTVIVNCIILCELVLLSSWNQMRNVFKVERCDKF